MSCINAALIATAGLLSSDCWLEQLANNTYQQAVEHADIHLPLPLSYPFEGYYLPDVDQLLISSPHKEFSYFECGVISPVPIEQRTDLKFYSFNVKSNQSTYRPLDHLIQHYQDWPEYRIVAYLE